MMFRAPGTEPPISVFEDGPPIYIPPPFGIAEFPAAFVPIRFPWTVVPVPLMEIGDPLFPDNWFPAPAAGDPMEVFVAPEVTMPVPLGTPVVPVMSTPIRLDSIELPVGEIPSFTISIPVTPFPDMMLPAAGPPMTLFCVNAVTPE